MMQRYFFKIAYQGTNYSGWQNQPTVISVQETIEHCLGKYFHSKVKIHGCGRTDKGVHASKYYFHIDLNTDQKIDSAIINKILPDDISFFNFYKVKSNANTQTMALTRTYSYFFHTKKIPSLFNTSYYFNSSQLDFKLIEEALTIMKGEHDFYSFCFTPLRHNHTICIIKESAFEKINVNQYKFTFIANRFLKRQIRILIDSFFLIGTKQMTIEEFSNALHFQTKLKYTRIAPPQGLYLSAIAYPKEIFE